MWNNSRGEFVRYVSEFRDRIVRGGIFQPEAGRYHLYISWACPWAHRTAITRKLLGLEDRISLSVVDPVWGEKGWTFSDYPGSIPDFVNGQTDLVDVYRLADPSFKGEETTPVLWDRQRRTIVNNESLEIIQMLASEFPRASGAPDLYPEALRAQIDQVIRDIYSPINNGVYRAGFALSQRAYERAFGELFDALDEWDRRLGAQRFLCGPRMTLADICMFTTLYRFDLVYYSHFKCNRRHIYEYPNLWGFVRDIYQTPGVAETCFPDHIQRHYYMSQTEINPTRIVPRGPLLNYHEPHGRESIQEPCTEFPRSPSGSEFLQTG